MIPYSNKPILSKGISIITPFFNQSGIFWETYKSVLAQSFLNWEWIIINDGSDKWETKILLKELKAISDSRVKIYDLEENRGLPAARNEGVKVAVYEYLFFIDSDDLIDFCYLEKAFLTLELNKSFAFVNSWSIGFGAKNYKWRYGFEMNEKFLEKNYVAFCGLFRKQIVIECPFNEEQKGGLEDWEFWINLAAKGYWGYTIPEFLFHYRTSLAPEIKWKNWDEGKNESLFKKYLKRKYKKYLNFQSLSQSFDSSPQQFNIIAKAFSKVKPVVLVVLPWLQLGGVEQFTLGWMKSMSDQYEFVVITTQGSDHSLADEFKKFASVVFHLNNLGSPVKYLHLLKYIIETRQPELLVLSHSEIIYSSLQWLKESFPLLKVADINHVVELHYGGGGFPLISSKHSHLIDKHIVVSKHLKQWMCNKGVKDAKTQVVYLGADIDECKSLEPLSIENSKDINLKVNTEFLIAFSGRLVEQKNLLTLLLIVKSLKQRNRKCKLIICGDGPDKSTLEDYIFKNKLDDYVTITGSLSHKKCLQVINAADVLILPSKWEGIATVLYEAMALGTPVIATDVGGQNELIDENSGILIPLLPEQQEMANLFVSKIEMLMDEPFVRKALSSSAQLRVANFYNKADSHNQLKKIFEELIHSKNSIQESSSIIQKGLSQYYEFVSNIAIESFTPIHLRPTPSIARLRLKKAFKVLSMQRPISFLWNKK